MSPTSFGARLLVALALPCALVAALRGAESPGVPLDSIQADSGRLVEIYRPAEPVRLKLELRNRTLSPMEKVQLAWRVRSWTSKTPDASAPLKLGEPLSLAPSGEATAEIEFTPSVLGWHELSIELRDAGGAVLDREAYAFSVGDTAKNTARHFRFGVCAHLGRLSGRKLAREVGLLDRLGVSTLRTELFSWDTVEKTKGDWNFSRTDEVLEAMAPTGVEIQHMLDYSTRWASTGDPDAADWKDWFFAAPRLEPWLNYTRTVLDRYGDRMKFLEIWNEPDIEFWRSPTAKYVELFDATSKLIKERRPQIQVINGGLAYFPQPRNPDFIPRFVAEASDAHWDVFAYHDYQTFAQLLSRREEVAVSQAALRKKLPLWINEGGYHTLLGGGENGQALTLVKKLSTAPALGIEAYFWYNLLDDGVDPGDSEHHFGLARHSGQPKPAWSAYQALIRELGDARYLRSIKDPKLIEAGVWAHLYERPSAAQNVSSHVLVLWQEGESRHVPNWLGVGAQARVTRVTDLMGNPVSTPLAQNGVVVTLGSEPLYVHIQSEDGSAPALDLKPLLEADPLAVLVPGLTTTFRLSLTNPLDVEAALELSCRSPIPGMAIHPESTRIKLAPRETAGHAITLTIPEDAAPASGEAHLELVLSIPEAGLTAPATIPVSRATVLRRVDAHDFAGAPVTPLAGRNDIQNLYSAQPRPEMHWGGVEDLSGEFSIGYNDTALLLRVVVRDDRHVQSTLTQGLWESDSLQLTLGLKEARPEFFEIGLARRSDTGEAAGWVFAKQPDSPVPLGRLVNEARVDVVHDEAGPTTIYRLELPWKLLGLEAPPAGPFRLGFIVNDDDGQGRKQWLKFTDGIGEQKVPRLWRLFVCQ